MTNQQAQRLRVLMQEALELVLGKPIAFVLVAQDEDRNVEVISNAANRESLPALLKVAVDMVQNEPDGTTKREIPDHAAPQAPAVTGNAHLAGQPGTEQPAAAAVSERCWVKTAEQQCEHQAAGGLRVNLYATQAIQKRYGKRVMLSLIFDLPVCLECVPKLKADDVMDGEQWKAFARVAQQRSHGVLADRTQTELVLCHWDEPEYVALRRQLAKHRAANESQPAPAGPQQGAGDAK